MRQLHNTPIAVSGSGHTEEYINSSESSIMCESASPAVLSRMQLTLHSPNISRRFALGAGNVCLVGEKSDVLRTSIGGLQGSIYGYTTTAMHDIGYPLPIPPSRPLGLGR